MRKTAGNYDHKSKLKKVLYRKIPETVTMKPNRCKNSH